MIHKKQELVGSQSKGKIFVLSAPAGTGKTTLVQRLAKEFTNVVQSISFTSRKPRAQEKDGIDYHFVTKEDFQKKIEQDDFLEYAKVYEDLYGTDKNWVEKTLLSGKHVFLVIDTQGALQLMEKIPAVFIFVYPPSFSTLKDRLEERKTESERAIEERLSWSAEEMDRGKQYDYHLINDDLEIAYEVLRSIVIAEDHRVEKI